MAFYTYMFDCTDGTIYTGHTEDLDVRLWQHQNGYFSNCYTWKRRPVSVLWSDYFSTRYEALEAERRIKGWTSAKKRALAAGDWARLSMLARNRTDAHATRPSTGSGLTAVVESVSPELVEGRITRAIR